MKDTIKDALRQINEHFSTSIFTDPKLFKNALSDVKMEQHEKVKIQNLLRIAMCEMKVYRKLEKGFAADNVFIVDNIISDMSREYDIKETTSKIVIESIAEELFGYVSKPQPVPIPQPNQISKPLPQKILTKADAKYLNGSVVIPYGYTEIAENAFMNRDDITSVIIPDSVTIIRGGRRYSSIFSVDYIGTFSGCKSLLDITIPSSVTSIGAWAFNDCIRLTSVTIPSNVTNIEEYAFCECKSLIIIIIPSSVVSVKEGLFCNCSSLTSITIPSSVTSVGDWIFGNCTSLISVIIPNSVTSIGAGAFQNCESLTNIIIPSSVISIGKTPFKDCKNVTVHCDENSCIHKYCIKNKIKYRLL